MKQIPENLFAYAKSPLFTQEDIPENLLKNHQTEGTIWGKLVVVKGEIDYVIESTPEEVIRLNSEKPAIIEPEVLHHVQVCGDVEFYIEFYK